MPSSFGTRELSGWRLWARKKARKERGVEWRLRQGYPSGQSGQGSAKIPAAGGNFRQNP